MTEKRRRANQGSLTDNGAPANGLHDFRFKLLDAASGGTQVGTTQCVDNLQVTGVAFTATLDFGNQFISPAQRFIEIEVRRDTGIATGGPAIALQDTNAASQQTGYVSYRDSASVERAWAGYGSAGDPNFSIINARPSGNIVLQPFSGNVGINTAVPAAMRDVGGSGLFSGSVGIVGSVGIGTNAPATKLDVRGNIRLGSSGQLFAAGVPGALRLHRRGLRLHRRRAPVAILPTGSAPASHLRFAPGPESRPRRL